MVKNSNKSLACLLLLGQLSGLPTLAAGPKNVVGKVVQSSGASLGGITVPGQGTILAGDTLSTAKGGSALVKISAATQASLEGETTVLFASDAGRLAARLSAGKLVVETAGRDTPIIETPLYRAEPAEPGKAVYLVAVMPDQSTVITSRLGKISIHEISSGKHYLLPEGYTARSADGSRSGQEKEGPKQAPDVPAGPTTEKSPPAAKPKASNTTLIILVGGGAVAGIGAALAAGGGGGGSGVSSSSRP